MKNCVIRTTVNVQYNRYCLLQKLVLKYRLPIEKIVHLLITRQVIYLSGKSFFRSSAIRYQEDAPLWKSVHVSFSPIEYDRNCDIKYSHRISISLILAMAIDSLSDHDLINNDDDSYPPKAYTKITTFQNGIRYYIFFWGIINKKQAIIIPP